jgi:methyltransferase (TIGR00027 family)
VEADRPSSTAILIAAATVFLARDPRVSDLVPQGAAELCERCLDAVPGPMAALARSPAWLRWVARLAERATIPGLLLHFMLRKRWIEEAVRAALAGGCTQLVVVGAGFDTLAARLAREFPGARFIEVDHPATQRAKHLAVEARSNLEFIAADLSRTRLQDALAGSGLRAQAASVFVVEGLLMYLDDAQIAALFAALGELQRGGGQVLFTVMEPAAGGGSAFHNATPLATGLLASWSEPFRSALAREDVAAFLAPFGLAPRALAAEEHLRGRYLAGPRAGLALARGELIVHAVRS